jgi:hypothetical protein
MQFILLGKIDQVGEGLPVGPARSVLERLDPGIEVRTVEVSVDDAGGPLAADLHQNPQDVLLVR